MADQPPLDQTPLDHTFLKRWVRLCGRRPILTLALTLLVTLSAGWVASQHLRVNTDQLTLFNPKLPEVKDIHRIDRVIGGTGRLTLALRGADPEALKRAAAEIEAHLKTERAAEIREVNYKLPVEFMLDHALLFMETDDLKELRRRVAEKLADAERRADPFFMEIEPTPPVELKLDDLLAKYGRVGDKRVEDDHFIHVGGDSPDALPGAMLLMHIKPIWSSNKLGKTDALIRSLTAWLESHKMTVRDKSGEVSFSFREDYSPELDASAAGQDAAGQDAAGQGATGQSVAGHVIEFGFTGSYKTNVDDSFQIKDSLAPVSIFAFFGVLGSLLLFFRRHIFSVFLVLSGLIVGLVVTFGWTTVTIGELNMITSILAGILMGLGIDFGIHLIYRLRDELARHESLEDAVTATLKGAGFASFVSGLGTMAAFASLLTSDFKGFSQFGFLAGSGVLIIGFMMYVWVPALILCVDRIWPGAARRWINAAPAQTNAVHAQSEAHTHGLAHAIVSRLPKPRVIALTSGSVAVALALLSSQVSFEYDSRALMVEGVSSVRLQEEIRARFSEMGDPIVVSTPSRESAREVHEYFKAHKTDLDTVAQVVGLDSFLPPRDQQERNAEVLSAWARELEGINLSELPEEVRSRWGQVQRSLKAKPFGIADLPLAYREPFEFNLGSAPGDRGTLTYVYSKVDLWDGRNVMRFAGQIEEVKVESGVYRGVGMPLIFSTLIQTVMRDGERTVLWTLLMLTLILAVDLRRAREVLIALSPLVLGMLSMLGLMSLIGVQLNAMNIVVFPIIIGYNVSHGVYLLHRVREGATPREALTSVGSAITCSTLTTLAGWAALLMAPHRGLQSMGALACLGMLISLLISFTLIPALLEMSASREALSDDSDSDLDSDLDSGSSSGSSGELPLESPKSQPAT